mmetsp:Transcript_2008/g.5550  ORF Transcript_2008/g.5550 Transcript_2008/m.5550 type:complete len:307 (-) Transcript_2008:10-930(-)
MGETTGDCPVRRHVSTTNGCSGMPPDAGVWGVGGEVGSIQRREDGMSGSILVTRWERSGGMTGMVSYGMRASSKASAPSRTASQKRRFSWMVAEHTVSAGRNCDMSSNVGTAAKLKNPIWFSAMGQLSGSKLTGRLSSRSLSPCPKNSLSTLVPQMLFQSRGLVGLEMSAAWTSILRMRAYSLRLHSCRAGPRNARTPLKSRMSSTWQLMSVARIMSITISRNCLCCSTVKLAMKLQSRRARRDQATEQWWFSSTLWSLCSNAMCVPHRTWKALLTPLCSASWQAAAIRMARISISERYSWRPDLM